MSSEHFLDLRAPVTVATAAFQFQGLVLHASTINLFSSACPLSIRDIMSLLKLYTVVCQTKANDSTGGQSDINLKPFADGMHPLFQGPWGTRAKAEAKLWSSFLCSSHYDCPV